MCTQKKKNISPAVAALLYRIPILLKDPKDSLHKRVYCHVCGKPCKPRFDLEVAMLQDDTVKAICIPCHNERMETTQKGE